MSKRLVAMGVKGYEKGFELTLQPQRLQEPLKRKKPSMFFVNSMSDLFHKKIPDSYIKQVFGVIDECPMHKFQILTKRAGRMVNFLKDYAVPQHAWIGVTVEDKKHGLPRIDKLRNVDSDIRFLSIEPLIEDLGEIDLAGIHWVIVGGESGPNARPMKLDWVVNIKRQCEAQNAAFFFKQWGGWGVDGKKRAKKANGRELLGRTWDGVPERVA
ncbi:Bacteriophage protein gp37 [hydrothermal vent metagenome]|uniref:Bacteriophage protein gp37 n=1 Tax=hydrothermal vent metagenome TaxID=652676 RepID=A0A3B0Y719_9ZZZZ